MTMKDTKPAETVQEGCGELRALTVATILPLRSESSSDAKGKGLWT